MSEQKLDASIIRRSFFNTSIADIYRAIDGGSLVGAYTLLLCSLDALANIASSEADEGADACGTCGQKRTDKVSICSECDKPRAASDAGKVFRTWCEKWLKEEAGQKNCRPQFLYELRCALVHAHGAGKNMTRVFGYQLQHDMPSNHWKPMHIPKKLAELDLQPGYILNLESLLAEYVFAAWKFFQAMEATWAEQQAVIRQRLLSLVGLFAMDEKNRVVLLGQPPATFAQMHAALGVLDKPDEISIGMIQHQIHEIFQQRQGMCKCNSVYKYLAEEHDRTERLKKFDFEKLGELGKQLHDIIEGYEGEQLDESDFRKKLKEIAKPADSRLVGFPDTEYPIVNMDRDFRSTLKELAFDSKKDPIEDVVDGVDDYLLDYIKALDDMMREAVSLNIIHEWTESDILRGMGVRTYTSF
jgi:hypothetical protein